MYKFREIESEKELEHFMHLRYERYLNSSKKEFIRLNDQNIDIDIYDLHSKHFGLFYNDEAVGSIRLVSHKSEIYDERAFNIGLRNGIFTEKQHSRESIMQYDYPDFPFVSNAEVPNSVTNFYKNVSSQKNAVLEGSRLLLVGKHKGLRLATFLIECAIVYSIICTGKKHAVLNCDSSHERFYKRYGFETINNQEKYYLKGRTAAPSYVLSLSSIVQKYQEQFQEMAYQYKSSNKILRAI